MKINEMIFCTSISPKHVNTDIQKKAINSWLALGVRVFSFNCKAEIQALKIEYPGVEFVETKRTMQMTYGKPLVSISGVLDWCKEQKANEFCLINSDVELMTDKETIERIRKQMENSIVLDNRVDYTDAHNFNESKYTLGIDVFFIHKKWLNNYPQSMHCFGMTFWDYFIPYNSIKNGIDVVFLDQKIAFHKIHKAQYSEDDWRKSGRFFLWENNLYQFDSIRELGLMSKFVINYIYNGSTRKKI